jgi:two-component system, NarL family, captular synthesis response regulator RcsB
LRWRFCRNLMLIVGQVVLSESDTNPTSEWINAMNQRDDARPPIRVILADDHPLILLAIESLLTGLPDLAIVGRARDSAELISEAGRFPCDLAVIDLHMPGDIEGGAFSMLRRFRERFPALPLVVLTMEKRPEVLEALLRLGVEAVMSKLDRVDLIPVAIVNALAHERYVGPKIRALIAESNLVAGLEFVRDLLSPREMSVLRFYASGVGVTEIAKRFGRSVKTISAQKCAAMRKLALHSDNELFRFAAEYGLLLGDVSSYDVPG